MKLYANDQMYLQNYDLAYMIVEREELPNYIYEEINNQVPPGTTSIDLTDEFNFAWKFRAIHSIEWLMDCEYILDYNEFKDYSMEELDKLIDDYLETWTNLASNISFSENICDEEANDFYNLSQNLYSLKVLSEYKEGIIAFPNLPDEYRPKPHHYNSSIPLITFPGGSLHRRLAARRFHKF